MTDFDPDDLPEDIMDSDEMKKIRGSVVQLVQNSVFMLSSAAMAAALAQKADTSQRLNMVSSELQEVLADLKADGYIIEEDGNDGGGDDFLAGIVGK